MAKKRTAPRPIGPASHGARPAKEQTKKQTRAAAGNGYRPNAARETPRVEAAPPAPRRLSGLGIALLVAFAFGLLLRFYGLNWDQGMSFHPDERNIANSVAKIRLFYPPEAPRQLNPQFFAYGGLSIYVYRFACEIVGMLTHNPAWAYDWGRINLVGRCLSAFFSTLTFFPIFWLARRVFDQRAALFAAILWAFCVTSIQIAHYSITESFLTLMVTLVALASLRLVEAPTWRHYALMGVLGGLSLAAKTAALSFAMLPLVAHGFALARHRGQAAQINVRLGICLLIAAVVFFCGSPFTFLNNAGQLVALQPAFPGATLADRILAPDLLASMRYEGGVVAGTVPVPYTLQFDKTPRYAFQLQNLFWQLGPVALFCIAGIPFAALVAWRRKSWEMAVFLGFPLAYFAYVGGWHTKFIRYMMPLVPFLLCAGGFLLSRLAARFARLGTALAGAMLGLTILWALAFSAIYRQEQTRIAASKWMYSNISPGARILSEHWDDGLPVGQPGYPGGYFRVEQLAVYDNELPIEGKAAYYAEKLAHADYIVFNSRRLYGTLMHLPEKYPLTSHYYRLLFEGKLGYRKVHESTSYPNLFGLTIPDDASEETFQVYEHPKVMVFENQKRLSEDELRRVLLSG